MPSPPPLLPFPSYPPAAPLPEQSVGASRRLRGGHVWLQLVGARRRRQQLGEEPVGPGDVDSAGGPEGGVAPAAAAAPRPRGWVGQGGLGGGGGRDAERADRVVEQAAPESGPQVGRGGRTGVSIFGGVCVPRFPFPSQKLRLVLVGYVSPVCPFQRPAETSIALVGLGVAATVVERNSRGSRGEEQRVYVCLHAQHNRYNTRYFVVHGAKQRNKSIPYTHHHPLQTIEQLSPSARVFSPVPATVYPTPRPLTFTTDGRLIRHAKHRQQRGHRHRHPYLPGPGAEEAERLRRPLSRLPPRTRDAAASGEERASARRGYDSVLGGVGAWSTKRGGGINISVGVRVGCCVCGWGVGARPPGFGPLALFEKSPSRGGASVLILEDAKSARRSAPTK